MFTMKSAFWKKWAYSFITLNQQFMQNSILQEANVVSWNNMSSIPKKISSWSFVDCHHEKNYIYDWNITLNYCLSTKSVPGVILSGNAMVASNTQVSLDLENCKWLKSYVNTVPMITSFKILKYFSCGKTSFFRFASLW